MEHALNGSAPNGPLSENKTALAVQGVLYYAYPILLLVFFLIAFTVRSIFTSETLSTVQDVPGSPTGPGGKALPKLDPLRGTRDKKSYHEDISRSRKLVFQWLSAIASLTFAADAANTICHALWDHTKRANATNWWCGQAYVIYVVGSFFVYALFLISLLDTTPSPTSAHLATWILAAALEIVLLGTSLAVYSGKHREPAGGHKFGKNVKHGLNEWEGIEVVVRLVRIVLLLALIILYVLLVVVKPSKKSASSDGPSESTGLLSENHSQNGSANGHATYGSAPGGGKHRHTEGEAPGWSRPTTVPSRSWWEYIRGYSVFFPYLWPAKDRRLQIMVVICFVLVILQRGVNVLVPYQLGKITDDLSGENGDIHVPWGGVCLFILYRLLQGSNGLLGAARSNLWIPVAQYSYRELSVAAFEHVHSLSLDFHLGKKTGEVISALGKGNSINTFLEQVTFQVVPMLVDLGVAIAYFLIAFDAYYALVVAVVTFWYIYLTIRMAQWRAEIRRQMVNADREEDAVKTDSLFSYETVKYFNAENYEFDRYRLAVAKYQKAEYKVLYSLNLMNVCQNLVFMLGLMVACFIAAHQVSSNEIKVGKFVSLITYMAQLQGPLNFFGTFYRMIQSAMINSERMLELFKEQPTVVDHKEAETLPSCQGDIRFNDIHFSYDERKPALHGLDFHCAPGTSTAFVGESGGGKSTVFRLLFRFYDTKSGSIQVDGHDVRDLTIDSVRRHIGVVPQDTVLFNETLMYNLKYAKPEATDEEVYNACRAASIHDKIMNFPDGYATKVGERGLRLSGGEKQRVAIARTILKGPRIIMLDEATAALDTETEQHIQEALDTLGQGRTMLVIAHRLSTITRADQILVLHEGKVAEKGTHEELLAQKGRYSTMWRKQVRAQKAAEEASRLKDKADRLRRESKSGSAENETGSLSPSEDEREKKDAKEGKKSDEQGNRPSSQAVDSD
ncbi:putative vacuolar ABC heavy metal transporter [Aulographum hederae CBS 113979]|uniref:Putative vacuolar ABC heavy metal transporter n=1 Tax=Aulographum hederae CBS 113979 TaxID=1176131 RepID=A0A6G1HB81_9PEZI|nr:putative vacuolar ABC heavy metal transporter [Aulographum hederae CBS 113979]